MSKCETREQFDREADVWKQKILTDPMVRRTKEFGEWAVPNIDWLILLSQEQSDASKEIVTNEQV